MPRNYRSKSTRTRTQQRPRRRKRRSGPRRSNGAPGLGAGIAFKPAVQRGPSAGTTQLTSMPLQRTPHFQTGMLYYENGLTFSGTTGVIGNYFFRANDAFDPNQTGTGHQPMGFDQMMLLFEQFYVLRSHIRVRFTNTTTPNAVVGVALTPDNVSIVSESTQEQGLLKTRRLTQAASTGDHTEINLTCDCPRFFGLTRQQYMSNPNFQGNALGVPTELVYFKLFAFDLAATSTVTIIFDVLISFDIFFQEPRQLGESLATASLLQDCIRLRKVIRPIKGKGPGALSSMRLAVATAGIETKS